MTFRQQIVFDLTQDDSQSLRTPGGSGEGEKKEDQTSVFVDGDVNVDDVDSYLHSNVTNGTNSVDLTGESTVINTSTSSSTSTRTKLSQTMTSRDMSPTTPYTYRRAIKRRKHTIQQQPDSNEQHQHQHEVQYLHTIQTPKKLSHTRITDDYAIAAALAQNDDYGSQIIQPDFKCTICLEDDVPGSQGHWIVGCRHSFCIGCLQSLIQSSMKSPCTSARGVSCPQVGCDGMLSITDIRGVFPSDRNVWELYSEWTSLAMLEREIGVEGNNDGVEGDGRGTGEAMTMRCPANRCNYTFVHECTRVTNEHPQPQQPEGTLFVCPMCQQAYCLNCKANGGKIGPAHDLTCGQRLEQLEQTKEERETLEEWKKENATGDVRFQELMRAESQKGATKPCPKCKRLITKNGGCDHMHCASCNHSYNWSQAGGYVG